MKTNHIPGTTKDNMASIDIRNNSISEQIFDAIRMTIRAKKIQLDGLDVKHILKWSNEDFLKIIFRAWPPSDVPFEDSKNAFAEMIQRFNFGSINCNTVAECTKLESKVTNELRKMNIVTDTNPEPLEIFKSKEWKETSATCLDWICNTAIPRLQEGKNSLCLKRVLTEMDNQGLNNSDKNDLGTWLINFSQALVGVYDLLKRAETLGFSCQTKPNFNAAEKNSSQAGFNEKKGPGKSNDKKRNPKNSDSFTKKKQRSSHDDDSDEKPAKKKPDYIPCHMCGKHHVNALTAAQVSRGDIKACKFHDHPDANKSDEEFAKSKIGLKYQKATNPDDRTLGFYQHLVDGKVVRYPASAKKGNEYYR